MVSIGTSSRVAQVSQWTIWPGPAGLAIPAQGTNSLLALPSVSLPVACTASSVPTVVVSPLPVAFTARSAITSPGHSDSPILATDGHHVQHYVAVPNALTLAPVQRPWCGIYVRRVAPKVTLRHCQAQVFVRNIPPTFVAQIALPCATKQDLRTKLVQTPVELGKYRAVEERGRQDLESFAAVWGRVWVARNARGDLHWLKQMEGDADGLSGNGLREVAILKQLSLEKQCPNIISFMDAFVYSGSVHIVCEHVIHDLDTYMEVCCLSAEKVASLSRQLAIALDHMHSSGILHRGLKPGNVLITPKGRLVVAGFATACNYLTKGDRCVDYADDFFCCTALCVRPPELLLGLREYSPAVDMWALGCLMATMALGRWVFYADTGNVPSGGGQEAPELGMTLAIFSRLGTPRKPHPLTSLSGFPELQHHWSPRGWSDAQPLLGTLGVDLLANLFDLDPHRRLRAKDVLRHAYFRQDSDDPDTQELSAESEDAVFQRYHARDLAAERSHEVWCLTAASAISISFKRIEGGARPSLCQYVWDFLVRPRCPRVDYAPALRDINIAMRAILVDWLSDVHESHHARPPVLFRTVSIIDAFLARNHDLSRRRFQLLGVVAFLIASKVEREFAWGHLTGVQHLADCTANTYTVDEITDMETSVLACIGWPVAGWGPYQFLLHYATMAHLTPRQFYVAQCCLEGSLLDYRLSRHSPSLLALAAYYLAALIIAGSLDAEYLSLEIRMSSHMLHPSLTDGPAKDTGRDAITIWRCVLELHKSIMRPEALTLDSGVAEPGLSSLRRRFSKERYMRVSELIWPDSA